MSDDSADSAAVRIRRGVGRFGLRVVAGGLQQLSRLRSASAIAPEPSTTVRRHRNAIQTSHRRTPVDVYVPRRDGDGDSPDDANPFPIYVTFHGGGFVVGDLAMDEPACRWLASTVGCVVVNVDYGLAPKHAFPAPIEECADVLVALYDGSDGVLESVDASVDRNRIAVGGQSAGGNIAAVLAHVARDRGIPLTCQILIYPPLDLAIDPATRPHEADEVLSPRSARFFNACYIPASCDPRDPRVSPVYSEDLTGLAPALVITAEHDMLCQDGDRYAASLADAGVDVVHREIEECHHGFTHFGSRERAIDAWELVADRLRETFDES